MSNHVTSCPNVLKLNYIDNKKGAKRWNMNINELGTMRGPISMLRTLNRKKNIDLKCWGIYGVQDVTSATFEKIDI